MKTQYFYKIPMERLETIFNAAAKCDKTAPKRDILGFLREWLADRHEMIVSEILKQE